MILGQLRMGARQAKNAPLDICRVEISSLDVCCNFIAQWIFCEGARGLQRSRLRPRRIRDSRRFQEKVPQSQFKAD